MTIVFPNFVELKRVGPPAAMAEHRAGRFRVDEGLDEKGERLKRLKAVARRVLSVRAVKHEGWVEVHGWCKDFDSLVPGCELPWYRWCWDEEKQDVRCERVQGELSLVEADDGLRQEASGSEGGGSGAAEGDRDGGR